MKVFLTGGTGFVGSHVLEKLLDEGHDVVLLMRHGSEKKISEEHAEECEIVKGNITNRKTVLQGIEGCDAVINLVGILREFPQDGITYDKLHVEATFNCVLAAQEHDVEKFLQMSAAGVRKGSDNGYYNTKWQAEVLVKESDIDYTIFRPTMIFGGEGSAFSMFKEKIESYPVFPLIGGGRQKWQPIHVEDVAEGIVKSLSSKKVKDNVVEMGGPDIYEFKEVIGMIADSVDENAWKIPLPAWLVKVPTMFLQYQKWYPLSLDMIDMLVEDNVVEGENVDKLLDIQLTPLENHLG